MAGSTLTRAYYGDVALYVESFSDVGGRDQVEHDPSSGDAYELQDRGPRLARTRLTVLFFWVPTEAEDHLTRYARFKKLVDAGAPQVFVHPNPAHGSYRARVGEFDPEGSSETIEIRVSVEMIQDGPASFISAAGAGDVQVATPEAVELQVDVTNAELEVAGLESDVPVEVETAASSWFDADEINPRQVLADASLQVARINNEIKRLELATHLERWPVYRAFVVLRATLLDTAQGATALTSRNRELYVKATTPLRVICARELGAADSEENARQVRLLNPDVPAIVPAGTTLKLPVREARR